MGTLFGTDGIRGVANAGLPPELALRVGRAVAVACARGVLGSKPSGRPVVVVGRDTRPSGRMLSDAVAAGVRSGGADIRDVGVLPSGGVAMLAADDDGVGAGVVVSASHNPAPDNGIKLLGPDGGKLSLEVESEVADLVGSELDLPTGPGIGGDSPLVTDPAQRYLELVTERVPLDLSGMRIVVDCANGAARWTAPEALRRMGADVVALNTGDGEAINDRCGATHPEVVAEAARAHGCIGLTFDGDADRVLAADEHGRVVDGDATLAILARRLSERGELSGGAVAVTVMSNQALRRWCASNAIGLVETPVGDRNVVAAMSDRGLVLGGEQSGHVLRLDLAPTGDGLLTALCLLEAVVAAEGRLEDLVPFAPFPQVLVNVPTNGSPSIESDGVRDAVARAQERLGDGGRVLIRPSGTEPLVRVMVEAAEHEQARSVAGELADAVREALGG
ncbi:MAG TPA: phosphoglucosamine mutase [Actinomycetota bacterium]|nr:phosphoglucosamine mutase [Actinomycetota bacterium]